MDEFAIWGAGILLLCIGFVIGAFSAHSDAKKALEREAQTESWRRMSEDL